MDDGFGFKITSAKTILGTVSNLDTIAHETSTSWVALLDFLSTYDVCTRCRNKTTGFDHSEMLYIYHRTKFSCFDYLSGTDYKNVPRNCICILLTQSQLGYVAVVFEATRYIIKLYHHRRRTNKKTYVTRHWLYAKKWPNIFPLLCTCFGAKTTVCYFGVARPTANETVKNTT